MPFVDDQGTFEVPWTLYWTCYPVISLAAENNTLLESPPS